MIMIDIPMPENCMDCPMSYWVRSGDYEGMMMCNAMEARDRALVLREPAEDITANYLVEEYAEKRPEKCPIAGEVNIGGNGDGQEERAVLVLRK